MHVAKQYKGYRLIARHTDHGNEYFVQVKGLIWHTVKVFNSDDDQYAYNCAEELFEMLIDDIKPQPIKSRVND